MPHIRIEYSKSLEPHMADIVQKSHEALAGEGIEKDRIKTRGIALDHLAAGDEGADGQMLHATLLLLAGRDVPTKKQYGDAIKAVLDASAPSGCKVTLEIRDMDPETYYL